MSMSRPLLILLSVIGLPACIGVPIAGSEAKPFTDVVGTDVVVGETTAAIVKEKLGAPDIEADSHWVYRKSRAGWNWLVCGYLVVTGGCTTSGRGETEYFLFVALDADDVVAALDILDAASLCESEQLCFNDELLMRAPHAAAGNDDWRHDDVEKGCVIYIYSGSDKLAYSGSVEINGRRIGAIVGDAGYFRYVSEPGRLFVSIIPGQESDHGRVASANFACGIGEAVYLRYNAGFWNVDLDRIDANEARDQLQERWLALTEVDPEKVTVRWLKEHTVFVVGRGYHVRVFKNKGPGLETHWASGDLRDTCASEIALDEYDLAPWGGSDRFSFAMDGMPSVDFLPICNSSSECMFPLLLGEETCRAWKDDRISYGHRNWLIAVEPHGDTYREVYSGDSTRLDDISDCARGRCTLSLGALRKHVSTSASAE